MARIGAKLLVLLTVLLMPLGMTVAPAIAHSAPTATMPMEHCPESAPGQDIKDGFALCTMACSAALPALDFGEDQPLRIVCMPDAPGTAERLRGLHPETATPPPKRS